LQQICFHFLIVVFQAPKQHLEKHQEMWILLVGSNGKNTGPQYFLLYVRPLAAHLSLDHS
jgi:hypothetical protein